MGGRAVDAGAEEEGWVGGAGGPTLAGDDTEMDISLARKRTGWGWEDLEGSEEMGGTVNGGLMTCFSNDVC